MIRLSHYVPQSTLPTFVLHTTLGCAGCGYPLHGLAESYNCPECGTPIRFTVQAHARNFAHPDWMWWPYVGSWLCMLSLMIWIYPVWWLMRLLQSLFVVVVIVWAIWRDKLWSMTPEFAKDCLEALFILGICTSVMLCLVGFWLLSSPHFSQMRSIKGHYPWLAFRICYVMAGLTIPFMLFGYQMPIYPVARQLSTMLSGPVGLVGILAMVLLFEQLQVVARYCSGLECLMGKRRLLFIFAGIWLVLSTLGFLSSVNAAVMPVIDALILLLPYVLIVVGIGQFHFAIKRTYLRALATLRRTMPVQPTPAIPETECA